MEIEQSKEERNKNIVRESLEAVFNRRDMSAFEKYWSPDYLQHSAYIPPGVAGLKVVVESLPPEARYDFSLMMAEGDFVMVHGRYSGIVGPSLIAVDIFRLMNGKFVEHWDVIQNEATMQSSKSGLPMFKKAFGVKTIK